MYTPVVWLKEGRPLLQMDILTSKTKGKSFGNPSPLLLNLLQPLKESASGDEGVDENFMSGGDHSSSVGLIDNGAYKDACMHC